MTALVTPSAFSGRTRGTAGLGRPSPQVKPDSPQPPSPDRAVQPVRRGSALPAPRRRRRGSRGDRRFEPVSEAFREGTAGTDGRPAGKAVRCAAPCPGSVRSGAAGSAPPAAAGGRGTSRPAPCPRGSAPGRPPCACAPSLGRGGGCASTAPPGQGFARLGSVSHTDVTLVCSLRTYNRDGSPPPASLTTPPPSTGKKKKIPPFYKIFPQIPHRAAAAATAAEPWELMEQWVGSGKPAPRAKTSPNFFLPF